MEVPLEVLPDGADVPAVIVDARTRLQKGEIIIKDNIAAILWLGKSWKKALVTHLI